VWRPAAASRKFACYMWEGYTYRRHTGPSSAPRRAAAAAMGERGKMCEERIAQIAAADGNPYKVLRVTEAATHAEIKKAYHKTVLLVRECAAIERGTRVMCMCNMCL